VALTRVFSIAQFYHFAFLVVSLALLGFGASGSLLALWPRLQSRAVTPWYALGFAVTTAAAYLFLNHLPFDSYSIAWDRAQVYLLAGNLLGLAVPFVRRGAGRRCEYGRVEAGRIYGANSGFGGGPVLPRRPSAGWAAAAVLLCVALGAARR
jgi:hypothetical protein